MPELRSNIDPVVMARLHRLKQHWGHRTNAETIAALTNQASDRIFASTEWMQVRAHAYRCLRQLKPELLFQAHEILWVRFAGSHVEVMVALGDRPYRISKEIWSEQE